MKVFYGEKLVTQKEHLVNNKNLIYKSKKLLVLSEKDCREVSLQNHEKLIVWGRIYAVLQKNGKYRPVSLDSNWDSIIKNVFKESSFEDAIRKIEGDYVGCLIKKEENAVIFGDSFNRKDVFYSLSREGLSAATSLPSVIREDKKAYDQAALANILSVFGMYAPKKHTMYKHVRRLGVGECLVLRDGKVRTEKLPFSPLKVGNYGKRELEEYARLLEDAVRIRGSDECNWIYLSSGWDSTSLLALLVKIYGASRVKAVIGEMKYAERSGTINRFEIDRAKKFADYYSVDLDVVPLDYTTKESIKKLEKIRHYFKDNHIYGGFNFYLLSEHVRRKGSPNDSVFCGEISDGAHNLGFSQFTTIHEHPIMEFREYSDKMASYLFGPTFFKSILDGTYSQDAVYKLLRSRLSGHAFENGHYPLNEYERKAKFISSFFLRNRRIPFYDLKNIPSLTVKGARMYESEMFNTYLKECADRIKPETIYSWILHLYNSFHWQGSTVKAIHETANYNDIKLNMPYWDLRLQQFLSKMPENWGRGLELRPTKYPLKCMLENKVDYPAHLQVGPHSYIYDVNPNFSLAAEMLYGSAFVPYFQEMLESYPFENVLDARYFNLNYYRKLTDDYVAGVELLGQQLSDLFSLAWFCWIGWY